MKNKLFNVVKSLNPKRNLFDMSHQKLLSLNMGYLYPVFFQEILPSDSWKVSSELLLRLHPLASPAFVRLNAYIHYFYVPYRMVWKNFEKYITGGDDGTFTTTHPTLTYSDPRKIDFTKGTLADYFGIKPNDGTTTFSSAFYPSALPFRAYNLIWNEYYRDQNLDAEAAFTTDDIVTSTEQANITGIRLRRWAKDYFTSALTDTQKGGEVLLPNTIHYSEPAQGYKFSDTPASGALTAVAGAISDESEAIRLENIDGLDITINDLRKASRLQEYLERNARSGSRMAEWLLAHWSVKSDDLRLNRPAYLGGGKQAVSISEVLANFGNDTTMPLGEMGGHGISVGKTNGFKYFAKEYGCIIGLLSVIPEAQYADGMPKAFIKRDKFDYPVPEFAHLGEEPIFNQELFMNMNINSKNLETFGYQSRYASYKSALNTVHGDFRDQLNFWTGSRDFADTPPLNNEFVRCDCTGIENKLFAVSDSQATNKLYAFVYNNAKAVRPLPVFGTPKL